MSSLPLYERFAQVMEHMVTHDGDGGHGYTWDDRWGDGTYETITLSDGSTVSIQNGDRDCSSGVISALRAVGVDTHGASYTGDMKDELLKTGLFEWVPMSVPRYAKRGDIYLNEAKHTSVCKSEDPDLLMQFSINENGGVHGGRKGDQTGSESNVRPFRNYPYDGRLVWKNRDAVVPGWRLNSVGWWWQEADGSWPHDTWKLVNGEWFWFDSRGYAVHDCCMEIGGKWYAFDSRCAMKTSVEVTKSGALVL